MDATSLCRLKPAQPSFTSGTQAAERSALTRRDWSDAKRKNEEGRNGRHSSGFHSESLPLYFSYTSSLSPLLQPFPPPSLDLSPPTPLLSSRNTLRYDIALTQV